MSSTLTIAGAGVFGLSAAFELARRGARVRVLEAARVGAGASGGVLGALSPMSPARWSDEHARQLAALQAAPAWWGAVEAVSGVPTGYARIGRLSAPGPQADALVAGSAAHWAEAMTRGPGHGLVAGGDWLEDSVSARIAPRRALAALAGAVRAFGGEVIEGVTPEAADLWCTGWSGLAEAGLGSAQKGQAAVLAYPAPEAPQLWVEGVHVVPHADGTVAVGSTSERTWTTDGTDAALEALVARVRAAVPALAKAPVIERWAGLRPRADTRRPVVGVWRGRMVANGGFKTGFALAPMVAGLAADLLDGRDAVPGAWRPQGEGVTPITG